MCTQGYHWKKIHAKLTTMMAEYLLVARSFKIAQDDALANGDPLKRQQTLNAFVAAYDGIVTKQ